MPTLFAVAIGGAVGASARYGVMRAVVAVGIGTGTVGPFTPLATFLVNVSGAFALGLLMGMTEQRVSIDPVMRTALAVGVLGSFTTFSTLMYEVVERVDRASTAEMALSLSLEAGLSLFGSIAFGLAAAAIGISLGRAAL